MTTEHKDGDLINSSPSPPASKEQLEKICALLARTNKSKLPHRSTSYLPYYRERHAVMFRDLVMVKLAAGQAARIATNPEQNFNTITNLLCQARKYLFDHLDPDGKWKELWTNTVSRVESHGAQRCYIYSLRTPLDQIYTDITRDLTSEIVEYLNSLAGKEEGACQLVFEHVKLTEEEIKRYTELLLPYSDSISFCVTPTSIHIINAKEDGK